MESAEAPTSLLIELAGAQCSEEMGDVENGAVDVRLGTDDFDGQTRPVVFGFVVRRASLERYFDLVRVRQVLFQSAFEVRNRKQALLFCCRQRIDRCEISNSSSSNGCGRRNCYTVRTTKRAE